MIGIIGGTSFMHSPALRQGVPERIVTAFGGTEVVRTPGLAMISRHGPDGQLPPHRIDHRRNLAALHRIGVRRIVCFGSVGGLNDRYGPGVQALISDFHAPYRVVTFHDAALQFTIPDLATEWRSEILTALRDRGCTVLDGGVYAETLGPRFETSAEIRALARVADVVGMTCASEATLAMELGIPIAIVATVDNVAHGLGLSPLTGDAFHETVLANRDRVMQAFEAVCSLARQ